jgi:hypothetical protein
LVLWAEMDLALAADECRGGNVPGQAKPLPTAKGAFAALPGSVQKFSF